MFGCVIEGNGGASVDGFVKEVVDVVGVVVVVYFLSDAWPFRCSFQEKFLVVGIAMQREGVDNCDLLFWQSFDGMMRDAIIKSVDLS